MGERQQSASTSTSTTRLYFSDLDDSSKSYTTINHQQQWWRKLFKYAPTSLSVSVTSTTSATRHNPSSSMNGSDEQDNNDVDIYLDFLEKRYRRIHENDDGNEKDPNRDELFSAMDWFVGHNSKKKIIHNDDDDDDNTTDEMQVVERKKESRNVDDDVIESKDTKNQDQDHQYQLDTFVVHQLIIPILRVRNTLQRQQQRWKQLVFQQLHLVARRMTTSQGRMIPTSLLWNRTCIVLGGKQDIKRTLLALGSTILLVFRPILHHTVFSTLLRSSSTSSLIRRKIRIQ